MSFPDHFILKPSPPSWQAFDQRRFSLSLTDEPYQLLVDHIFQSEWHGLSRKILAVAPGLQPFVNSTDFIGLFKPFLFGRIEEKNNLCSKFPHCHSQGSVIILYTPQSAHSCTAGAVQITVSVLRERSLLPANRSNFTVCFSLSSTRKLSGH